MKGTMTAVALIFAAAAVIVVPAQADVLSPAIDSSTDTISGWADLDIHEKRIEGQIQAGIGAGELTDSQAQDFRALLDQLGQVVSQMKASGKRLGFAQSIAFSRDLHNLSQRVEQAKQAKVAALPDVDALEARLQKQLSDAVKGGKINQFDAADLQGDLQHASDVEAALKSTGNGSLDPKAVQLIVYELNKVQLRLGQELSFSDTAIKQLADRRAQLEQTIDDGVSAQKLTQAQADGFKRSLQHGGSMQTAFQVSHGALSAWEIFSLAGELDRLEARIDQQMRAVATVPAKGPATSAAQSDIELRLQELRKKVADTLIGGKLTLQEADRFNADLDEVAASEATAKGSSAQVSDADRNSLNGDLDRFERRFDQLQRVKRAGLSDIDRKKEDILKRINDALSSGTLTRTQADPLIKEYDRITNEEAAYKAPVGAVNQVDTTSLSNDINRLDAATTQMISGKASSSSP